MNLSLFFHHSQSAMWTIVVKIVIFLYIFCWCLKYIQYIVQKLKKIWGPSPLMRYLREREREIIDNIIIYLLINWSQIGYFVSPSQWKLKLIITRMMTHTSVSLTFGLEVKSMRIISISIFGLTKLITNFIITSYCIWRVATSYNCLCIHKQWAMNTYY